MLISSDQLGLPHTPIFRCRHLSQAEETFWRFLGGFILSLTPTELHNADGNADYQLSRFRRT